MDISPTKRDGLPPARQPGPGRVVRVGRQRGDVHSHAESPREPLGAAARQGRWLVWPVTCSLVHRQVSGWKQMSFPEGLFFPFLQDDI